MAGYLLVANQTLGGAALTEAARERIESSKKAILDTPLAFHVVVPATAAKDQHVSAEGDAVSIAQARLDLALERLRSLGVPVTGEVGSEDPVQAVGDALRGTATYVEIIIFTLPRGVSRWLRTDLPHKVERRFDLRVTTIESADDGVSSTPSGSGAGGAL